MSNIIKFMTLQQQLTEAGVKPETCIKIKIKAKCFPTTAEFDKIEAWLNNRPSVLSYEFEVIDPSKPPNFGSNIIS